jgi:hypothetical protein
VVSAIDAAIVRMHPRIMSAMLAEDA